MKRVNNYLCLTTPHYRVYTSYIPTSYSLPNEEEEEEEAIKS